MSYLCNIVTLRGNCAFCWGGSTRRTQFHIANTLAASWTNGILELVTFGHHLIQYDIKQEKVLSAIISSCWALRPFFICSLCVALTPCAPCGHSRRCALALLLVSALVVSLLFMASNPVSRASAGKSIGQSRTHRCRCCYLIGTGAR